MKERMILHNRPDDNTLGAAIQQSESDEQLEKNRRDQFDVRLYFAEAISKVKNIPLAEAMRNFTDLHVRLTGKFPGQTQESGRLWEDFISGIPQNSDHEQLLDHVVSFSKRPDIHISQHEDDRYWPFRYDYSEKDRAIDLHFGSIRPDAGDPNAPGILSSERFAEMRQKLKDMFAEIKAAHPDAEMVRGGSWLYNREAYRRLYPASYTANPRVRRSNKFTGGGTWGQFRDKTGAVNNKVRGDFLKNLEHLDPENLEEAFPNKTLLVSAPISEFYKEYGIE